MTKLKTENREATAIRELSADELDLVSGGGKASTTKERQQYLVVTMSDCLVSGTSF
jgi:hypothetical protein